MIYYPLRTLVEGGIKNIMIIVGKEHMGDVMDLLGSGRQFGCELTYRVQDKAGGIAEALGLVEGFARLDKLAVILGDNIFDRRIPFVELNMQLENLGGGAFIFTKEVPDPQRFGVPEFEDGRIIRIVEKPETPPSSHAILGLYIYDFQVWDIIHRLKPSNRGELEITDVNNAYIDKGQLHHYEYSGFWSDAGTHESLYQTTCYVRDNPKKFEWEAMHRQVKQYINYTSEIQTITARAEFAEKQLKKLEKKDGQEPSQVPTAVAAPAQ